MAHYSYTDCLERSYRVNWKIKDAMDFTEFDLDRAWFPDDLSGGRSISCLSQTEKKKLTHVEMGAYAHLFGFVESFIAPQMVNLTREHEAGNSQAFEALTNFAAEEIKHMHLFREVRRRVDEKLGFPLELIAGEAEIASAVLSRSKGAVLLLTSAIEWLTQYHFTSAMKDSDELDPQTKEIFRLHWMEECQHARLDYLETLRTFKESSDKDRDAAIEDLIWLFFALDGLLQQQVGHDLLNLERHLARGLTENDRQEIQAGLLTAKRHCFIQSGLNHLKFQDLFLTVTTPAQRERVHLALGPLLEDPRQSRWI